MGMFVVAPAASFNHHHHHHHHHDSTINLASSSDPINDSNSAAAAATALGVGVIPLLTAAPCLTPPNMEDHPDLSTNGRNRISGLHFWQNQDQYNNNNIKKTTTGSILDHNPCSANLLQAAGNTSSSSGTTTCQDCGNQAKKDCTHRRCRTCCKSRGYDCATHVKSTWVPAARRRERQLMASAAVAGGAGSSGSTSGVKKPRLLINSQTTTTSHTSTSNTTPPRSFDTSSSHQDVSFKEALPGQVRAPAVFKCVRVTAMDDGQDEYAYQAVVKIGGHVFKGFLYDQGVESGDGFPNISELQLGGITGGSDVGGGGGGDGGGRNGGPSSSSPLIDPSDVYGASSGGFLGGSAYAARMEI